MRRPNAVLLPVMAALTVAQVRPAGGAPSPILHERIPPDPQEDLAFSVAVDGDLPAALSTPSGLVRAPDPRKPVAADEATTSRAAPDATFRPDRDTHRPDVLPYDDPFVPSTAPFKRLVAYDMVTSDFSLGVRDTRMVAMSTHAAPASDGSEEAFYANMVIDLAPGQRVRIPSVGPGARIVHARAGIESIEIGVRMYRDGAENWFVESDSGRLASTRVRLVMQIAIARSAFGGELGDPAWESLPAVPSLPPNVAASATEVAQKLGVSRAMRPRDVVAKLVAYFRSFTDSDEPPRGGRDIYVDLALSKKGVCRHRAFAFLITAQHLGIPTRMIVNEAHAWVEVHDGMSWRRIDLGGAGRMLGGDVQNSVAHTPPPDPFAWPPGSTRGEDLADRTRREGSNAGPGSGIGGGGGNGTGSRSMDVGDAGAATLGSNAESPQQSDGRASSMVTLTRVDVDARRGAPLHVEGEVSADGEPCASLPVDIVLREVKKGRSVLLGSVVTDAKGAYAGALVIPSGVPLGDYDVFARTQGDARCGKGGTP